MTQQIIDQLMSLGLSSYESKCYIALLQSGKSSGYQISKLSGIPRARIYDTLAKLETRGMAVKQMESEQTFYTAKPYQTFIDEMKADIQHTLHSLEDNLSQLQQPSTTELIIASFNDEQLIRQKISEVIRNASHHIYISCWPDVYQTVKLNQHHLIVRGIIFDEQSTTEELVTHRHTTYTSVINDSKWFIIINDQDEMVYGSDFSIRPQAYYSNDAHQVYLMKNFIWHDILVNELVARSQDEHETWIEEKRNLFFNKKTSRN